MSAEETPVRLRPEIVATPAYKQGRPAPADGYKLSSNENPYPPLPAVLEAVEGARDLNRYPATGAVLRERLAERYGVTADRVHLGAGSISIITQLVAAAAGPGDEVVYPWRSFEAYPGLVTVSGATSVQVPLLPDGRHDLDAMAAAVTERTRAVIVCTPNNPTGPIVTRDEFARFLAAVPEHLLVILDEAYREFVTDPEAVDGVPLLAEHPNLVVLRTFSKAHGLAGLRIGYGLGPAPILAAAAASAIAMAVTDQAQAAALASLEHEGEVMERVAEIADRRDCLRAALREQGWAVPEAQGNFVWLPTGTSTAAAADALWDAGLVVRAFPPEGIRVSVGEPESVDKLLSVTAKLVRSLP